MYKDINISTLIYTPLLHKILCNRIVSLFTHSSMETILPNRRSNQVIIFHSFNSLTHFPERRQIWTMINVATMSCYNKQEYYIGRGSLFWFFRTQHFRSCVSIIRRKGWKVSSYPVGAIRKGLFNLWTLKFSPKDVFF